MELGLQVKDIGKKKNRYCFYLKTKGEEIGTGEMNLEESKSSKRGNIWFR